MSEGKLKRPQLSFQEGALNRPGVLAAREGVDRLLHLLCCSALDNVYACVALPPLPCQLLAQVTDLFSESVDGRSVVHLFSRGELLSCGGPLVSGYVRTRRPGHNPQGLQTLPENAKTRLNGIFV